MSIVFGVLLVLLLSSVLVAIFLSIPAEKIGGFVRVAIPSALIVLGVMLTLVGRVGIGIALAGMGAGWIMRNRSATRMGRDSGKRSTVRSAMFDGIKPRYRRNRQPGADRPQRSAGSRRSPTTNC